MPTITHKARAADGSIHDVYEVTSEIRSATFDGPSHFSALATWTMRGGKKLNKSGDTLSTPDGTLVLELIR